LRECDRRCILPSIDEPNNLVALMWDDLDPVHTKRGAVCPYGMGGCLANLYKGGRVS
jgi:hypothetical protein